METPGKHATAKPGNLGSSFLVLSDDIFSFRDDGYGLLSYYTLDDSPENVRSDPFE